MAILTDTNPDLEGTTIRHIPDIGPELVPSRVLHAHAYQLHNLLHIAGSGWFHAEAKGGARGEEDSAAR